MPRVRYQLRAVGDFEDILRFTAERFGQAQADSYQTKIERGVDSIAANPRIGRPYSGRSNQIGDVRRYAVGRHMVFYQTPAEGEVLILRILHQSMDFERHFERGQPEGAP